MKKIYTLIILITSIAIGHAQTDKTSYDLNYNVSQFQKLRIHNFEGNVTVKATSGNELKLSVTKILTSNSRKDLEKGKTEISLDTTVIDGEFIVFVNAPNRFFEIDEEGNSYYNGQNYNNWNKSMIKKYNVKYEFIIEAQVPRNMELYAGTHRGDVHASGIQANTTVKSHHGSVFANTGGEKVKAKSHHGDITIEHTSPNVTEGYYKTHHGDIKTSFPALSAEASLKSYHGSFYSDFDYDRQFKKLQVSNDKGKAKYKYSKGTVIKIGAGKGSLYYKTHHGDTYISKK